jgi:Glycosyltransferases involved in cell wall biogenesis
VIGSLSLVIPVYNEEGNLNKLIRDLKDYFSKFKAEYELIFVDDGSSDQSVQTILKMKNSKMKLIEHGTNKGYGEALKTGFENARMKWVGYIDGDNQFEIEDLDKLIEEQEKGYDLISGNRKRRADSKSRIFIGNMFNKVVRLSLDIDFKDVDCGIKMFRRGILDEISLNSRRTVDAELVAKSKAKGYCTSQVDVNHYPRDVGTSEASGILGVRPRLIAISLKELIQIKADIES